MALSFLVSEVRDRTDRDANHASAGEVGVSVRTEFDVSIASLLEDDYGSLREQEVDYVRGQLSELVDVIETKCLVVDLSSIRFGAAFLGMLVVVADRAKAAGKELVVVGDELGLFGLSRLDRLIPVFQDLDELLVSNDNAGRIEKDFNGETE